MQLITGATRKLAVVTASAEAPASAEVINAPSTLAQLVSCGSAPAVHLLSQDLFYSLEMINGEKCWFKEISEKEIHRNRRGRFSLSVNGNMASQAELPDTAVYASQDYWMPVFSYLVGRVRLTELNPGEVPGILFNYLQTMLLILRVRLVFVDQEGYYSSASLFDQLPMILDKLIPEYRTLFTKLLTNEDKTPRPSDLRQIKKLFFERVVVPPAGADLMLPAAQREAGAPAWGRMVVRSCGRTVLRGARRAGQ
ncbi:hypothetical protein ACQ86N_39905 [Puia sp. P3]|uniref:hypothetical protein n=1 Tax=Puia sp. P3 TaxID=3423952 RepID=UPI003D66F1CC